MNLLTFGLGRGVTTPEGVVLYDLTVLREPRIHVVTRASSEYDVTLTRTRYTLCQKEESIDGQLNR